MTGLSEKEDPALEVRQWLNEHLADSDDHLVRYPPHAVVDALAALGLPAQFDIGWSEVDHNGGSGITRWICTLATDEHLVDVTAEAQRRDDHLWTGNDIRAATDYGREPVVAVKVSRLDDVCGLELRTEGSSDASDYAQRPRQTWAFTFANGGTRDYVLDGRKAVSRDRVEALCRRLAASI